MEEFAYATEIELRYRDLDPFDHVNNAVLVTYIEEGRIAYFLDVVGADLESMSAVVASLSVEFDRPITFGQSLEIAVGVPKLTESSVPMEFELRADDAIAARGECVIVTIDRASSQSVPVPEHWRQQIRAHEPQLDAR